MSSTSLGGCISGKVSNDVFADLGDCDSLNGFELWIRGSLGVNICRTRWFIVSSDRDMPNKMVESLIANLFSPLVTKKLRAFRPLIIP